MRQIELHNVEERLYQEIGKAGVIIDSTVKRMLKNSLLKEKSPIAKEVISDILKNGEVAEALQRPLCQDTGVAVLFVEVGEDISYKGSLKGTIFRAVERAYKDFYLRKSMVKDPLFGRENSKTNLPALIHWDFIKGDSLKITFAAKGGGSENMSRVAMLKPADGIEGVKKFVLDTVVLAGGNPCPPIIVGVGVGGNFETCAILAKKSLLRDLEDSHKEKNWAQLEDELLTEINKSGIGPQGLGGDTTALAVKVEQMSCHIASLPVAVNIQCHSHRHVCLKF